MKYLVQTTAIALACSFAATAYATQSSNTYSAKRGSVYVAKKAECKREAKAKKFGIHLVQRNRWIKDCIAGSKT